MNFILTPIRAYVLMAVITAVVVGGALFVRHEYELGVKDGKADVQAAWDAAKVTQQTAALAEAHKNAEETRRRLIDQQEAQRAHDEELVHAQRDAAAAADAADGLRRRIAALAAAARRPASDPAIGGVSPPASAATGMLADVLVRADERAGVLANVADARRRAGLQCERDYDALDARYRALSAH